MALTSSGSSCKFTFCGSKTIMRGAFMNPCQQFLWNSRPTLHISLENNITARTDLWMSPMRYGNNYLWNREKKMFYCSNEISLCGIIVFVLMSKIVIYSLRDGNGKFQVDRCLINEGETTPESWVTSQTQTESRELRKVISHLERIINCKSWKSWYVGNGDIAAQCCHTRATACFLQLNHFWTDYFCKLN